MPTYSYLCDTCRTEMDIVQKFNDQPLSTCPKCQAETLHRIYRPVGIVFKGSGFYATDHKSPSGVRMNGAKTEKAESDAAPATTPTPAAPETPKTASAETT